MIRPLRFTTAALAVALALGISTACLADGNAISKINGSIQVDAGQHAGDLSTVNGAITLADNASAAEVATVNGAVRLEGHAQATQVHTVNGSIGLAPASRVTGDVKATNGGIHLGQGADVAGRVANANGAIELDAAHVGGGIATVNGDVDIGAGSRVEGGLLVDKPTGWTTDNRLPHIVIGPRAVVQGTLEFHRGVVLQVSDQAQIDPVKGATVERFHGATP